MRKPVVISVGFHAAILLATLVILPAPKPFEVKPSEVVQVDISQITDKTQKVATATEPAPKIEKPAPKETKIIKDVPHAPKVAEEVNTATKEPTPPPEPKKLDPPKPKTVEPKPLDPTALTDLLKKTQEPPPEKKPELKKPEKKKQELKLDDIAAFLDKKKGEKTAPQKPTEETGSPQLAEADAQGNDQLVTATLINALTSKVKGCVMCHLRRVMRIFLCGYIFC